MNNLNTLLKKQDWKKEFMDFYFERDKYAGRKLGPEQYINFIEKLHSQFLDEVIKVAESRMRKYAVESMPKTQWVDEYNQALSDLIATLKEAKK